MKLMNLRTLGYGSILGLLLFGVFAFLVPGMKYTTASNAGFLVGIVSVFVPVVHSFFKTQTTIQTYNSWSPFGFTWNLPAYISLHLYN